MRRTLQPLALVGGLLLLLLPPRAASARAADGGPTGPTYRVVEGKIAKVDREKGRVAMEEGNKVLEISYDRNTSVFLERRLGTVRDVVPAALVRASVDEDGLASWIEVLTPAREAPPTGPGPTRPGCAAPAVPR